MPRLKRLYRVTAEYLDPVYDTVRHFQTMRSAEAWAKQRREGYEAKGDLFGPTQDAIPPATKVTIEPSNPITWPDEETT